MTFSFLPLTLIYPLLACIALVVAYLVYTMIYVPLRVRWHLRKFKNVYLSDKATVLGADLHELLGGAFEDKRHLFSRFENAVLSNPKTYDLFFASAGSLMTLAPCSVDALQEFKNKVPQFIDRGDSLKELQAKLALKGLLFLPSNASWSSRRKGVMRKLGLHQVSNKIPLILHTLEERFKDVQQGERLDLSGALEEVTMTVMTKVLFGEDSAKSNLIGYENSDGDIVPLSLFDALRKISDDSLDAAQNPFNLAFPFLARLNLGSQNRRVTRNVAAIHAELRRFLAQTTDKHSVFY